MQECSVLALSRRISAPGPVLDGKCRVGLPGGFGSDLSEAMSLDGLGEGAALNVYFHCLIADIRPRLPARLI